MPRTAVLAEGVALKGLPFSAAVRAGEVLYLSGQVGLDAETGRLADGVGPQTVQIFKNLAAVLDAVGKGLDDVVKVNVYLADMSDYPAMNEAYSDAFVAPYPARTAIGVAALPLGARVEIEAIVR